MPVEELINATRKYLNEHLEKDLYLFGYFKDNKLVSISGFILENHFPTNSNLSGLTAYITTVYTIEMYRRRGYQKELLRYVLDYAKKMEIVRYKIDSCSEWNMGNRWKKNYNTRIIGSYNVQYSYSKW